MVLGIGNVLTGITPYGSMAHQAMGMCLFLALVLAWFDARRDAGPDAVQAPLAPQGGQPA
jgi:heme A synthase